MPELQPLDKADRAEVAAKANEAAKGLGFGHLRADSSRETIINWMQRNDPNGCHTDDLAAKEDIDPYTLDDAWAALAVMLEGT
jgi:hypothetical protein